MVGILRSILNKTIVLAGLLVLPSVSFGYCIAPIITPTECDFKNEDTNLYLNQPGKKFIEDEAVERILSDSKTFIESYYNTTKTTGDAAIIADIAAMAAEVRKIEIAQIANTGAILANDPWNLKPLYTDIICLAVWTGLDLTANALGYPVGSRDCPTTSELLVNFQYIQALDDRGREIEDILQNQFRNVGEVWGDVADDIQRFEDQFKNPETLSRNLLPNEIVTQYDEKYSSFVEMITNPVMKADEWNIKYQAMDETVNQTIRDTLMATQANAKSMLGKEFFQTAAEIAADTTPAYASDVDEFVMRNQKSRDSVGRMQSMELQNMGASLSGQAWVDIASQQNATGMMMGNVMAKEASERNYQESLSVHMRKELHPIPDRQAFGDETAYTP